MCGIFGVVTRGPLSDDLAARCSVAIKKMTHRGPDAVSEVRLDRAMMCHSRLGIIDLSPQGRQPMKVGDSIYSTVNGEIYNHLDLRIQLESAGERFTSNCDSEVLPHSVHAWGIDGALPRLEGMYAAAILDANYGRLDLFRDRVGIKPLFFLHSPEIFAWSSEIGPLADFGGLNDPDSWDRASLLDFLVYRSIPSPKTIYSQIAQVRAAEVLSLDLRTWAVSTRRYWYAPKNPLDVGRAEWSEAVVATFTQSVQQQLMSDVPVGVFLSAGVDSSSVLAASVATGSRPECFTLAIPNAKRDESHEAIALAQAFNLPFERIRYESVEEGRAARWLVRTFGQPFADSSALALDQLSRAAARSRRVVLSGDGGDELFLGYRWYSTFAVAEQLRGSRPFRAKQWLRRRMPHLSTKDVSRWVANGDPVVRYAMLRGSPDPRKIRYWQQRLDVSDDHDPLHAYREYFRSDLPAPLAARWIDFHTYLADDILVKVDRVTMKYSIECRPPILATGLVELAFIAPLDVLWAGNEMKGGFKSSVASLLPSSWGLSRLKTGFSAPKLPSSGRDLPSLSERVLYSWLDESWRDEG